MQNTTDLILNCANEWRQIIERIAKQHKLTFSEWRALIIIVDNNGIEQQQLARTLNIAPNNTVNIADSLVKKNFITKKIKQTDKKIRLLTLSHKKEKQAREIHKLHIQLNKSICSSRHNEKVEAINNEFEEILSSIQKLNDTFR